MPRNLKYPLTPLREHRDREVDVATVELGAVARARAEADAVRVKAELLRLEAEARANAVRSAEADRLLGGEASVADLARVQAWEHAARTELTSLGQAVENADVLLTEAQAAESASRALLASSTVARDVVVKDQERFEARFRRAADAAEEEAAEELGAARFVNEGRGA